MALSALPRSSGIGAHLVVGVHVVAKSPVGHRTQPQNSPACVLAIGATSKSHPAERLSVTPDVRKSGKAERAIKMTTHRQHECRHVSDQQDSGADDPQTMQQPTAGGLAVLNMAEFATATAGSRGIRSAVSMSAAHQCRHPYFARTEKSRGYFPTPVFPSFRGGPA
jgi:hypothetical protein